MSRTLLFGLLLAVLVATALRLPQLDARPMHNDEGLNAEILRKLWDKGSYQYNPDEFHGPTLPYFTWAWMKLAGPKKFMDFTDSQLRMVTVFFGLGLILLLPLVADGLGRRATVCAAMLTAISPAMVFYSRYFIHEMLLVFFKFLALAAGWRYFRSGKLGWALLCGLAIGLMQATKETFVLAIAAAAGAVTLAPFLNRREQKPVAVSLPGVELTAPIHGSHDGGTRLEVVVAEPALAIASEAGEPRFRFDFQHTAAAIGVWLLVVIVLFSSFFTNAAGPLDAIRTYLPWLHRAGGASPHIHPWSFYLERLAWFHSSKGPVWSEGLILVLSLIGFIAALMRKGISEGDARFIHFVAFYSIILTCAYCAIGYKTPWCLLSFWNGMILLAGVGTVALFHWLKKRPLQMVAGLLLLAGSAQLTYQAWRADLDYASDPRNPYVYAQTVPDVRNLVDRVNALATAGKTPIVIKVMAPENNYGPLPWYLRRFDAVGWYSKIPSDPYASVMILSTKFNAALDEKKTHLMIGLYELRPQNWFEVYVETNLWNSYLNARKSAKPEFESAAK